VRNLELLPDAQDAVAHGRLTALARLLDARPGFRLASTGGRERLETFVSDTLALRAAKTEHAIEQLHTSFRMADGALPPHSCRSSHP
jgi:hypothetical protein